MTPWRRCFLLQQISPGPAGVSLQIQPNNGSLSSSLLAIQQQMERNRPLHTCHYPLTSLQSQALVNSHAKAPLFPFFILFQARQNAHQNRADGCPSLLSEEICGRFPGRKQVRNQATQKVVAGDCIDIWFTPELLKEDFFFALNQLA